VAALTPWLRVGAPRAYGGPKSSRSIAFDVFRAALEETYPGKAKAVEVIDFFGRDEAGRPWKVASGSFVPLFPSLTRGFLRWGLLISREQAIENRWHSRTLRYS